MRYMLLIVVAVLAAYTPGAAFACSCVSFEQPIENVVQENAQGVSTVISADVIEVEDIEPIQRATLQVVKSWKGPLAVGQVVVTETNFWWCGLTVSPGQRMLLFLAGPGPYAAEPGPYSLSPCASGLLAEKGDMVKILDALFD